MENLALYQQQPQFLASAVTGDEAWVHYFDLLHKEEAKERTKVGKC